MLPITIVIPCHDIKEMTQGRLIQAILDQTVLPKEVVVVYTGDESGLPSLEDLRKRMGTLVELKLISCTHIFPGRARNIGVINSSQPLIAFLDLLTIPNVSWLEDSHNYILKEKCDGVIGSCRFLGENFFSWILIDSLFGRGPVSTLPGSLFKRSTIDRVGPMLERQRSGEDNEWLQRAHLMDLNLCSNDQCVTCSYLGYSNISFLGFARKWIRNYWRAASLPQYKYLSQVNLVVWVVFVFSVTFNWNSIFAERDYGHPLYIPHITKATVAIILLLYVLFRAIFLPISRGSPWSQIISLRLLLIISVVAVADLIKSACFLALTFRGAKAISFYSVHTRRLK